MGRLATSASAAPFSDLVSEELSGRGYDPESREFIQAEFGRWSRKRRIVTERDALAELNLAELTNLARLKGQDA